MASSSGNNGMPVSAAMLMDPKAMKKHLANGTPTSSLFESPSVTPRQISEPAILESSLRSPIIVDFCKSITKDDAYNFIGRKGKNPITSHVAAQNPSQPSPRQLLDPKGFDKSQRQKEQNSLPSDSILISPPTSSRSLHEHTDNETALLNGNGKRNHDEYEEQGMGSLIERVHNVTERQERPQKKPKSETFDEDDIEKKAAFAGGGKGGEIGEYMKKKREEGLKENGAANAVVDLTGGDDEEVVMISDSNEKEVCYGRIDATKVNAHQLPYPSGKTFWSKGQWPPMKLQLKRLPGKDQIIRVIDPMNKDFGTVDVRTSRALARILDSKNPKFRTQARLTARTRKTDEYPGMATSEYLDMTVNLYGPKSKVQVLGKFLSQKNIWLRTPFMVDANIEVINPHAPAVSAGPPRTSFAGTSTSIGPGAGYVTRTVEEVRNDVVGMFDSLQQSEDLPEMEPDPHVTTELLSHQKQGLHFLTIKETEQVLGEKDTEDNRSLWRLKFRDNGTRSYYNIITGKEERTKPPEVLGGILADMMGLGKTLSILSLIVGSLPQARLWEQQPCPEADGDKALARNSRTTLLVSPLSTVANWEDQITNHLKPGTLKYYVYHGGNRLSDIHKLAEYDIVITTYSIVSSEFMGRGKKSDLNPLLQTNFFRIVLDEAHMIREQSTRQSQAICALSAQRRWAVTGTPVQNRLDDLGALIKFLRIQPFCEKGGFAQFIMAPFKNADPEILPKLRLLVDSITLRRLKDRIDLPGRQDHVVRLPFNEDEQVLYDWFSKDSQNRLRIIAGEHRKALGGKSYAHILRAIMRLRLICAHGRELLSEDDLKITEGFSQDNAINIDDEEAEADVSTLNQKQAYEMLMLNKETGSDECAKCRKEIEISESEMTINGQDDIIGYMLPCYRMLCKDCREVHRPVSDQSSTDNDRFQCPFCQGTHRTSFFELTKDGIEAAEEARAMARENPRQAKIMGRYSGPHTKVKALLEALQQSREESKTLPSGEQPIKSVVFSGWTANLDLIQIALEDSGIKYVRLDGRMSRKNRNASLDAFRDDPTVCIILISITAGGLGLNLTSGSKVYVMEPQFNPAAEQQAVDRIHRLGQKREVFTYRFIMENSFEEKMLELQRKKQSLADLSMNRGKLDKAEALKQKLDSLRSLFK